MEMTFSEYLRVVAAPFIPFAIIFAFAAITAGKK